MTQTSLPPLEVRVVPSKVAVPSNQPVTNAPPPEPSNAMPLP